LKRVHRNNDGNPIEELYYFHFETQIIDYIDHLQEVPMDVQSNSNDLLVTVHASQDKKAAGRILWFNMGYEDSVDKIQLKHMLNQYLEYEMVKDNQALAGLNDEMVSRLFQKVRNDHGDMETLRYADFNRSSLFRVTRQQSDGRRIPENVTLWEWIYHAFEILNMTTIRTHWNHGFIVGFISRKDTEERLLNKIGENSFLPNETAIIRFADSGLGAISVARSDFQSIPQVTHHHFLRTRELVEESLHQRIQRRNQITFIAKTEGYAMKSEMVLDPEGEILQGPPYDENI